jgi:hypothetical protein
MPMKSGLSVISAKIRARSSVLSCEACTAAPTASFVDDCSASASRPIVPPLRPVRRSETSLNTDDRERFGARERHLDRHHGVQVLCADRGADRRVQDVRDARRALDVRNAREERRGQRVERRPNEARLHELDVLHEIREGEAEHRVRLGVGAEEREGALVAGSPPSPFTGWKLGPIVQILRSSALPSPSTSRLMYDSM